MGLKGEKGKQGLESLFKKIYQTSHSIVSTPLIVEDLPAIQRHLVKLAQEYKHGRPNKEAKPILLYLY